MISRFDFSGPTVNVLVGKQPSTVEHFSVHANLFTKRSKFLRAARKPEWLDGDSPRPVDLSDAEPAVFHAYLGCVYRGPATLELEENRGTFERKVRERVTGCTTLDVDNIYTHVDEGMLRECFQEFGDIENVNIFTRCFSRVPPRCANVKFTTADAARAALNARDGYKFHDKYLEVKYESLHGRPLEEEQSRRYEVAEPGYAALVNVYLLADKLQDPTTVNMVLDAIYRHFKLTRVHPGPESVARVHDSLVEDDPLYRLFIDMWTYAVDDHYCSVRLRTNEFPRSFFRAIAISLTDDASDSRLAEAFSWDTSPESIEYTAHLCDYHRHDEDYPICFAGSQKSVCRKASMSVSHASADRATENVL